MVGAEGAWLWDGLEAFFYPHPVFSSKSGFTTIKQALSSPGMYSQITTDKRIW